MAQGAFRSTLNQNLTRSDHMYICVYPVDEEGGRAEEVWRTAKGGRRGRREDPKACISLGKPTFRI